MILRSPSRLLGRVQCPICLQWIHWRKAQRVEVDAAGNEKPFAPRRKDETSTAFEQRRLGAQRTCTMMQNGGGASIHYLPDRYGEFGDPIVIGLVGDVTAGKTLMLAAMVQALRFNPHLSRLGLSVNRLDPRIDARYRSEFIEPFLYRRQLLARTNVEAVTFTYVARVRSEYARREVAIAFFDVSGEQLKRRADEWTQDASFLSAVNGLMFMVDPDKALPMLLHGRGQAYGDPAFTEVLDRLIDVRLRRGKRFLPIPAAMVVTKSDLLQYKRAEVDKWLSRDDDLHLGTVAEESEDVYDFLAGHGADQFLRPVDLAGDVTLHFASASGVSPEGSTFPQEGFGPRRVLRPLLSLFAMLGLLDRSLLGD